MKLLFPLGSSLVRILVVLFMVAGAPVLVASTAMVSGAHAAVVNSISVSGNERVDAETVRSVVV